MNIEKIETNVPSPKTANVQLYTKFITYTLQHFQALTDFYGFITARTRWCNYISAQQSIENAANILINGSKKYNKKKRKNTKKNKRKRPKITRRYEYVDRATCRHIGKRRSRIHKEKFEEGDRNKSKRVGVSEKLYRHLRIREKRGELLLLDINEYNTSKTCNSCLKNNLEHITCGSGEDKREIHQVFVCKNCNIYWNRDVMASKNMFTIAQSIWNGQGRPIMFTRQCATSNVVAPSHSGDTAA